MASSLEYKNFIIDELSLLDGISIRPMMGEYILYYNGIIFGGIYDDRLLVKKTDSNRKYNMEEVIPYKNAKPMCYVIDVDNKELLRDIILDTYRDL